MMALFLWRFKWVWGLVGQESISGLENNENTHLFDAILQTLPALNVQARPLGWSYPISILTCPGFSHLKTNKNAPLSHYCSSVHSPIAGGAVYTY